MVKKLLMDSDNSSIFKYSVFAVSYLISNLSEDEIRRLNAIILFGSVSQNNAMPDSDVDIFVDIDLPKTKVKALKTKLNKAAEQFYLSNIALEYKLKGIDNQIRIIAGKLDKWPDLKRSIASTGISLYQKYNSKIEEKSRTLFSIDKVGKLEGALLNKLYGYKSNKKKYPGVIEKINGLRLGRAFMIPSGKKQIIIDIFRKYDVNYQMHDIWV